LEPKSKSKTNIFDQMRDSVNQESKAWGNFLSAIANRKSTEKDESALPKTITYQLIPVKEGVKEGEK